MAPAGACLSSTHGNSCYTMICSIPAERRKAPDTTGNSSYECLLPGSEIEMTKVPDAELRLAARPQRPDSVTGARRNYWGRPSRRGAEHATVSYYSLSVREVVRSESLVKWQVKSFSA
jgi:hypothetical protein